MVWFNPRIRALMPVSFALYLQPFHIVGSREGHPPGRGLSVAPRRAYWLKRIPSPSGIRAVLGARLRFEPTSGEVWCSNSRHNSTGYIKVGSACGRAHR